MKRRFSRCSFQELVSFTVIVDIAYWRVKGIISIVLITWLLSSQDPTGHQELFYMWEIPFILVFTVFVSWYFKIVWPQVCFSLLSTWKASQKCTVNVIVARKRELSQSNLCLRGVCKFSPKHLCTGKMPF